MSNTCALAELLKQPRRRLTREEWNNFGDLYMRMENDDKSADEVDIGSAISRRIAEIKAKGSVCWL